MSDIQNYRARSGATQYKPSLALVMVMNSEEQGFCLACGEVQEAVEPDARKGTCASCGASKVYGAEELASMGLVF